MSTRRSFTRDLCVGSLALAGARWPRQCAADESASLPTLNDVVKGEDVFSYLKRHGRTPADGLYAQILGAANEFKEGDEIVGVAAASQTARQNARELLANTKLEDLEAHPVFVDELFRFIAASSKASSATELQAMTLGDLKEFLLTADEPAIQELLPELTSDVIGCVVKIMSNDELIQVGAKIFHPLPDSQIGAKGYLSARVQPNSPTDHPEDIAWQVFDAWAYAVGDLLLGTNPVSSEPESVAKVEGVLQDILKTFGIDSILPHCVLSHIDVQAQVEQQRPNTTALWFQSIAGNDSANATFDISVKKMEQYAQSRNGRFALYFETGQGADFTNGHGHGCDMVLHEARKYGFARELSGRVSQARLKSTGKSQAWVHLNDVAGFIGPEVFRTKEQLVRCCLEDIVMGKLHGLCIGLDVCSTLHMDISLDDLDWCLEQVMPAHPAYLMALPTKIDPMLGYLTTAYQDHVRLRAKFGRQVNDAMWRFFQDLGVIDTDGQPTRNLGDPTWVYLQYRRRKRDDRPEDVIIREGQEALKRVRGRGVFVAEGYGSNPAELAPQLQTEVDRIYKDAKSSIWAELTTEFLEQLPQSIVLQTQSSDRTDYILHPMTGEQFTDASISELQDYRNRLVPDTNVQIVVSDGLNALAIMANRQLIDFLDQLRQQLADNPARPSSTLLVVKSGRVRAGYRAGELLFANQLGNRAVLHVIGERPGTGHHTFSTYITSASGNAWARTGSIDHNITKVVSGIADTALAPRQAAQDVSRLLLAQLRQG